MLPNIAYALILLSLVTLWLAGASEAYAISPYAQFKSGIPLEEIQCTDEKVLLESPRGTPACVRESSVEKLVQRGFVLVPQIPDEAKPTDETPMTADDVDADKIKEPIPQPQSDVKPDVQTADKEPIPQPQSDVKPDVQTADKEPVLTTLRVASPVAFVDDGRDYGKVIQRRPAPNPYYEDIMAIMTTDGGGMVVGQSGDATFYSVDHEKYSINPEVGFYTEDWLPTHIPDGYKLLYGGTHYENYTITVTEYEEYKVFFRFVPTTFVLHEGTTDYDVEFSEGFWIEVVKTTAPIEETEDKMKRFKELFSKPPVWYGGFRDMEREEKSVYAFEGGNSVNPYRSALYWKFADDSYLAVHSDYLTLDEIVPIFESIKN